MRAAVALVLALALVLPQVAAAADVSPQARAKARAHIKKARGFYDQEQYDQAVVEYESAYKLVGVSDILFNIGQILRTKGDKPAAVKAYRRYLQVEPSGGHAEEARDYALQLTKDQVPLTSRDKWDFVENQKRPPAMEERWQKLNERVGAGDLSGLDAELASMQSELNRPAQPLVIDDAVTRHAAAAVVKEKSHEPARPLPPYAKKWWFWTAIGGGAVVVIAIVVGAVLGQPGDPMPSLGVLK
jgi:tetratricopeptide (TPR) repeat protein